MLVELTSWWIDCGRAAGDVTTHPLLVQDEQIYEICFHQLRKQAGGFLGKQTRMSGQKKWVWLIVENWGQSRKSTALVLKGRGFKSSFPASVMPLNKALILSEAWLPQLSIGTVPPASGVIVGIYTIDVKPRAHNRYSINYECVSSDRIIRIHRFHFAQCVHTTDIFFIVSHKKADVHHTHPHPPHHPLPWPPPAAKPPSIYSSISPCRWHYRKFRKTDSQMEYILHGCF